MLTCLASSENVLKRSSPKRSAFSHPGPMLARRAWWFYSFFVVSVFYFAYGRAAKPAPTVGEL